MKSSEYRLDDQIATAIMGALAPRGPAQRQGTGCRNFSRLPVISRFNRNTDSYLTKTATCRFAVLALTALTGYSFFRRRAESAASCSCRGARAGLLNAVSLNG
jgi:hypothetical protein